MNKGFLKRTYPGVMLLILTLMVSAVPFVSCVDDNLFDDEDLGVIDGSMRDLHVEISFEAEDELDLQTRATDSPENGDYIQNVKNLNIVIYNAETGELHKNLKIVSDGNPVDNDIITNVSYKKYEGSGAASEGGSLDMSVGKVTFDITLVSDKYYMYAVANADDLPADAYSDRKKLKNTPRRWIVGDLSKNSEMFGVFSHGSNKEATDDEPLAVTNKTKGLHCWLRRLASKLTVAFDGTELYDNVQVFVQSITLHDIPQQCLLGNPNKAGRDYSKADPDAMLSKDARYAANSNGLIASGASDLIADLDHIGDKMLVPSSYKHVCNRAHAYLGMGDEGSDPTIITNTHAHDAKSLFFYENMQGTGKSKKQDADGDDKIDFPEPDDNKPGTGWKDEKPFGTYVEVYGYYRCAALDGNASFGPIRYRFMLGQDVDRDYNATRNTHYKLTLKLRGYANDYDWHIDYKHQREFIVNNPLFVSYLFNKKTMANIKIAGEIPAGYKLKAEILEDKGTWKSWGDGSTDFPKAPDNFHTSVETYGDGPWYSFLSLRRTSVIKIEDPKLVGAPSTSYKEPDANDFCKKYYNDNHKGWRLYDVTPKEGSYESNDGDGAYFVTATRKEGDRVLERTFSIPLYTRAKELVTRTGFTGNNPYVEYSRKERVKFYLVDASGNAVGPGDAAYIEPVTVDVIQVPRIVNPKGVWRSMDYNKDFHVTLMHPDRSEATGANFREFRSIGKWSAEVITASSPIVTLTSTDKGSGAGMAPQNKMSRIEGESEHPIDFKINFTGIEGFAIVKVRYHNYQCEHDIFCRKGYGPVDVTGDGKLKWNSFNVDHFDGTKAVLTTNPLDEGSLFRKGNYDAILSKNNDTWKFNVVPDGNFEVLDHTTGAVKTQTWSEIAPSEFVTRWDIDGDSPGERIATGDDFYTFIAEQANDINFKISKGYGVLYGDGAEKTQEDGDKAYGYRGTDGKESENGMRGVIVYNNRTYRQIFLPIGSSGYGHRHKDGTMRYAGRKAYADATKDKVLLTYRPIFYDLFRRPGAIYWLRDYHVKDKDNSALPLNNAGFPDSKKSSAFDINYYTMGFEGYSNDAMETKNQPNTIHGAFIRTVIPQNSVRSKGRGKTTGRKARRR